MKTVQIKVRRLDSQEPDKDVTLELDPNTTYPELKKKFLDLLDISGTDDKVFKIRNSCEILVPLSDLIGQNSGEKLFIIEVTQVHHDVPAIECHSPLHSVYVDAVKNRLRTMETRISRVESLVPQLKWRRQSLLERTTHTLESRVAFLDRRIDDLTPPQWHEHLQNVSMTMS